MTEHQPPHPFDYVTRDQIQDLWGIGFTIVKRARHIDPFHVPPEMVPHGRSYQWWHLVHDRILFHRDGGSSGWAPVPASRHDGWFMPFGHTGAIEVGGLGLFEKSKVEVDAERAAQVDAANKQAEDWAKQAAAAGFDGAASIGRIGRTKVVEVGKGLKAFKSDATKTVDTTVGIPRDMTPHIASIFKERDELYDKLQAKWRTGEPYEDWEGDVCRRYDEALEVDPAILKGPAINALLLPIAIENVRKALGVETPMLNKFLAAKKGKANE